jgi:TIR domain
MSESQPLNIYTPVDLAASVLPAVERVFISHRRTDKPLAMAVAAVLAAQGLHYWFDENDEDTRQAADLGKADDQALVYSIERGIRHCTQLLGLLSAETRGSWWVPYEIGFSRSQDAHTSFSCWSLSGRWRRFRSMHVSRRTIGRSMSSFAGPPFWREAMFRRWPRPWMQRLLRRCSSSCLGSRRSRRFLSFPPRRLGQ